MRRALLISLSLVLALVGWSAVGAEDGFYVIPAMRGNYAPVPKTGQTSSYDTGDDGAWHKGVAWPTPRFTDNNNGTVTDNLTELIWMKDANAIGRLEWGQAIIDANGLADGSGGLTDGSKAGDWRLPNVRELQSLVDYRRNMVALPAGHPFINVQTVRYWSSTTSSVDVNGAWWVWFADGSSGGSLKGSDYYVWCVRGGT